MVCQNCGTANPVRAKFCLECGTALVAAGSPRARRETRRIVTVVFCDMTGSTGIGERLDAESLCSTWPRRKCHHAWFVWAGSGATGVLGA